MSKYSTHNVIRFVVLLVAFAANSSWAFQTSDSSQAKEKELLAVLRSEGGRLSELKHELELLPQALVNVRVKERRPLEELDRVQTAIGKVERELGNDGRILVRFSGTEPKARVLVEGPNARRVEAMASKIASEITRALG